MRCTHACSAYFLLLKAHPSGLSKDPKRFVSHTHAEGSVVHLETLNLSFLQPTKADEVFAILLDCLDRESKIAARKVYKCIAIAFT